MLVIFLDVNLLLSELEMRIPKNVVLPAAPLTDFD